MTILSKITLPMRRVRGEVRQNPMRDWFTILVLSSLALIGIIVWGIWTFDTVTKGGIIGSSTSSSPPIFNNSSLSEAHKVFAGRSDEAAKYETGAYQYVDPSHQGSADR